MNLTTAPLTGRENLSRTSTYAGDGSTKALDVIGRVITDGDRNSMASAVPLNKIGTCSVDKTPFAAHCHCVSPALGDSIRIDTKPVESLVRLEMIEDKYSELLPPKPSCDRNKSSVKSGRKQTINKKKEPEAQAEGLRRAIVSTVMRKWTSARKCERE